MGNCCSRGKSKEEPKEKSQLTEARLQEQDPASAGAASEPAAEPQHPSRLLSPTSSIVSTGGRTVYHDAEEGEDLDVKSERGDPDEEVKPSLWDMVASALVPYRSTNGRPSSDGQQASPSMLDDGKARASCLGLGSETPPPRSGEQNGASTSQAPTPPKPEFGRSIKKRASMNGATASEDRSTSGIEVWEEADPRSFMVRGTNYAHDRKKVRCQGAIYSVLLGVDIYSFEQKINHIARHVTLPRPPQLGQGWHQMDPKQQLPPLLVINVQLPTYPPSMWGATDGKGQSLVYYFSLPEGWEPEQLGNANALALAQRWLNDGAESDKSATRDRLKLIARVGNVEEWYKAGPLSGGEYRLINKYNDKPLMTRPQHLYHTGPGYLEVDIDVHSYAYIARRAFAGFIPRLSSVVFENAFVVQGNRAEELPELLLACARVSRVDFNKVRPFPGKLRRTLSHRMTIVADKNRMGGGSEDEQGAEQAQH